MGVPFELNYEIEKNESVKRLEENLFELKKDGYHLFPMDVVLLIRKKEEKIGKAIIKKLEWKNNQTWIVYELKGLDSVN